MVTQTHIVQSRLSAGYWLYAVHRYKPEGWTGDVRFGPHRILVGTASAVTEDELTAEARAVAMAHVNSPPLNLAEED